MATEGKKRSYGDYNDEQLMLAYQEDDVAAFEVLYERSSNRVYGYLRKRLRNSSVIDDVFQETFIKLHQARHLYRRDLSFAPWLFTICRTTMIDVLRRRNMSWEHLTDISAVESTLAAPEVPMSESDSVTGLLQVPGAHRLSADQAKAVELRFGADLSFDEIAKTLGTSPLNARQLVNRGLKRLKSFVHKTGVTS